MPSMLCVRNTQRGCSAPSDVIHRVDGPQHRALPRLFRRVNGGRATM